MALLAGGHLPSIFSRVKNEPCPHLIAIDAVNSRKVSNASSALKSVRLGFTFGPARPVTSRSVAILRRTSTPANTPTRAAIRSSPPRNPASVGSTATQTTRALDISCELILHSLGEILAWRRRAWRLTRQSASLRRDMLSHVQDLTQGADVSGMRRMKLSFIQRVAVPFPQPGSRVVGALGEVEQCIIRRSGATDDVVRERELM